MTPALLDSARRVTRSTVTLARARRQPGQFHFDAERYEQDVRANIVHYDELQEAVADATRDMRVESVLDLGIGSGGTAAAVLEAHPAAQVTGIDASSGMLAMARQRLPPANVSGLLVGRLQDPLPDRPFDLVVSALAVHHLTGREKRRLFTRIRRAVGSKGRFVLADVIRPERPEDAVTPVSRIHDHIERADDLERWLVQAGFAIRRQWACHDLVVLCAGPTGAS